MITSLEELVGIIAACIPKLRPVFRPKGVSNDDHQSAKSDDLYHQNRQKRFQNPYSITRALRSTTEDLDGTSGDRSFSDASAEQILVPINGSEWIKPRTVSPLMSPWEHASRAPCDYTCIFSQERNSYGISSMIRSTRSECLLGKNEISIAYLVKFIDVPVHITTSSGHLATE